MAFLMLLPEFLNSALFLLLPQRYRVLLYFSALSLLVMDFQHCPKANRGSCPSATGKGFCSTQGWIPRQFCALSAVADLSFSLASTVREIFSELILSFLWMANSVREGKACKKVETPSMLEKPRGFTLSCQWTLHLHQFTNPSRQVQTGVAQ